MLNLLRGVWRASLIFLSIPLELIPSCQDIKHAKENAFADCSSCANSLPSLLKFLVFSILVLFYSLIYCYGLFLWAVSYILCFQFLSSPIATLCSSANFSLRQLVNINFVHRYLLFAVRCIVFKLFYFDICMSCWQLSGKFMC